MSTVSVSLRKYKEIESRVEALLVVVKVLPVLFPTLRVPSLVVLL
jgi:hypothetical protein